MSKAVPFEYGHEERGNVVVQDLTDWDGETAEMDAVESEWLTIATQDHITATVTEFGSQITLGPDTQTHLAKEWTENAKAAGIDKIAFVSDGIEARAVSANLDVPQEINAFNSLDDALDWAQE
jgi:hypothetical protein